MEKALAVAGVRLSKGAYMVRTYAVTGAVSGIGKILTEQLRGDGDTVITIDLQDADVTVDLTTVEGRRELVAQVQEKSGGALDGVIACAGLSAPIVATVAVNYFGAVATLEGLRPLLAASSAPRAAVISSLAALQPLDDELYGAMLDDDENKALARARVIAEGAATGASNTIYNSSKNAIALWVRQQAITPEWAGQGIALNAIAPGVIETPMTASLLANEEGRRLLAEGSPAPYNGPAGSPSAPAGLLRYLTSEDNDFVTGQVIFIDGGAEATRRTTTL